MLNNRALDEARVIVAQLLPELDLSQGVNLYLSLVLGSEASVVVGVSDSHLRYLNRTALLELGWSKLEFRLWLHRRLYNVIESGVTPSGQGFSASPRVDNPNDD